MNISAILLIILLGVDSMAGVPKKYFNCDIARQIKEPKQSQGYFMDASCSTVYVKPPIEGKISLSGFTMSLDDVACKSVMSTVNLLNRSISRNELAIKELEKAQKHLDKENREVEKLQRTCDKNRNIISSLKLDKSSIGNDLQLLRNELLNIESNLVTCVGVTSTNCYRLKNEKQKIASAILNAETRMKNLDFILKSSEYDLDSCINYINTEISRIRLNDQNYNNAFNKLQTENEELVRLLNEKSDTLMKQVGGELSIGLFSKHNDLVQKFKSLNQNLNISFQPLVLQNAVIHFDRIEDGLKAGFPVQLHSSIRGLRAPSDTENGVPVGDVTGVIQDNAAFGEGAGGSIVINRYTACSIAANYPASSADERLRAIANTLKPTVTFSYDVQVKRDIKVKYNEANLYQLIKKSTSKRGLFRSRSSSSITERSEAEKWIQIDISSEDERVKFENSEKLMMDIRSEYLDAALIKVAKGYLTTEQVQLKDPGDDGATKSSKELNKNCTLSYCQYAAIALNIGSALFGGSASEAGMNRTVSAQASEQYNDVLTVREFGQQTLQVSKD